jgi:hypothetical protein
MPKIIYSDDKSKDCQIRWMVDYITEESFSAKHLEALCWIVGLFNECKESEKEIFDFAQRLYDKYAR